MNQSTKTAISGEHSRNGYFMRFFGTFKNLLFRKNTAFVEKVGYKVGYFPPAPFVHFVNIVQ